MNSIDYSYFSIYEDTWKNKVGKEFGKRILPNKDESWEDLHTRLDRTIFSPSSKLGEGTLYKAIQLKCEQAVAKLTAQHPDWINPNNKKEYPPLLAAVAQAEDENDASDMEIIENLITHGADIHAKWYGMNALHLSSKNIKVFSFFMKKGVEATFENLENMLKMGHLASLDYIMKTEGFDVNALVYQESQMRWIHVLSTCRPSPEKTKALKWLLQNGCCPNVKCVHGLTPLHLISEHQTKEDYQLLLSYGAKENSKDHYGYYPSDYWKAKVNLAAEKALKKENDKIVNLLQNVTTGLKVVNLGLKAMKALNLVETGTNLVSVGLNMYNKIDQAKQKVSRLLKK